jgi:hypothetical protein
MDTLIKDKYDAAYDRGYSDGLTDEPSKPPAGDESLNYDDGYRDGSFKRKDAARG